MFFRFLEFYAPFQARRLYRFTKTTISQRPLLLLFFVLLVVAIVAGNNPLLLAAQALKSIDFALAVVFVATSGVVSRSMLSSLKAARVFFQIGGPGQFHSYLMARSLWISTVSLVVLLLLELAALSFDALGKTMVLFLISLPAQYGVLSAAARPAAEKRPSRRFFPSIPFLLRYGGSLGAYFVVPPVLFVAAVAFGTLPTPGWGAAHWAVPAVRDLWPFLLGVVWSEIRSKIPLSFFRVGRASLGRFLAIHLAAPFLQSTTVAAVILWARGFSAGVWPDLLVLVLLSVFWPVFWLAVAKPHFVHFGVLIGVSFAVFGLRGGDAYWACAALAAVLPFLVYGVRQSCLLGSVVEE